MRFVYVDELGRMPTRSELPVRHATGYRRAVAFPRVSGYGIDARRWQLIERGPERRPHPRMADDLSGPDHKRGEDHLPATPLTRFLR